jgi:hypothetical protein
VPAVCALLTIGGNTRIIGAICVLCRSNCAVLKKQQWSAFNLIEPSYQMKSIGLKPRHD